MCSWAGAGISQGEDELLSAGAFRVYRGADELLGAIDELGI
jgi:hypothetical protein